MGIKVVLAYASTHGSTQQVAEAVAATLRERLQVVDLKPAREVRSLDGYHAVVLGAPLYMFHLHKDALHFLARHQRALAKDLPVAIFAGGPIESETDDEWQEVRRQLDQELAKFPWLKPVDVEIIGGIFDPARLHFPWRLIPALRKRPPSDLRDWEAIRCWAGSLAEKLQLAAV